MPVELFAVAVFDQVVAGVDQRLAGFPVGGHLPLVAVQAAGVGQVEVPAQGGLVVGNLCDADLHAVGAVFPFSTSL